ncbi:carbohydrate porin [Azomonas macrocytogenes]|uniref:Porin n=1 Tax=Azomonas macrocytogenes TaxID=69962 RepID=A0A839T5Q5_AZOMA|nr:carbohydrate porin [Azomonas macrocytogenes]MBB3104752.1 porin [Azomonas macrocytogenes]
MKSASGWAGSLLLLMAVQGAPAIEMEEAAVFSENLTGDWGGLRSALAARGVEIGLDHTADLMAIVEGGLDRHRSYSGLLEPTLSVNLERLLGWRGGRLFVHGITPYGGRDPIDSAGSIHAPSNLATGVDTFKLYEAWFEQRFFDDRLAILAGLYAADSEFDVKETAGIFMNGGFGTGIEFSETGLNGPCIYPTSCLGVRVRVQPTQEHYLQVAVLDGVAGDPKQPHGTQVHLGGNDGALILGEAGIQHDADEHKRFLHAAVGAWYYTARFDHLRDVDAEGNPRRERGTQGAYALIEGELFREPDQSVQGLSGFLRLGLADKKVNQLRWSASGGLVYTGLLPGRDEDVTGFGISLASNSGTFKDAQRAAGEPVTSREVAYELSHWLPLTSWMSLQFNVQYIRHPSTDPGLHSARIIGLRHKISF